MLITAGPAAAADAVAAADADADADAAVAADAADAADAAEQPHVAHDWGALVEAVQRHVKSLNFGYRSELMTKDVKCAPRRSRTRPPKARQPPKSSPPAAPDISASREQAAPRIWRKQRAGARRDAFP